MKHWRYYSALVKTRLSKDLVYRFNFWVAFITDLLIMAIQTIVFIVIYQHADVIGGWSRQQTIIFMATFIIVNGLAMGLFFFGILRIPWMVQTGGLDLEITKPVNTAFLVIFKYFDFGGLLGIVPGIALLIGTVVHYRIPVGVVQVIGYVAALLVMTAMYMALMVLFRLPAFWMVRTDSLEELEGELSNFAWRVPGVALRGVERLMFLVVLPYGLVATVPTEMLTGALSPVGILAIVLIAVAQMTLAAVGWRLSLRRYSSASS